MSGYDGAIYKTCREAAGMTQEQAAERLNCSVRTLARYETGEQRTPDDVAYYMAVLYDSQYLAVQHLRLVSQVAAELLPPVAVRELPVAAIRIINRVRAFAEQHREQDLLDIAEDGVISPAERPLFDEIMAELREMVQAILELGISEEGDSYGTGKRGIPGQSGAHPGGISGQGDHHPEGAGPVAAHGQPHRQGHLPHEGRRHPGRHMLDLRGKSGPGHVVRIKKGRPAAGTAERSGFRACAENDCKIIVPHSGLIASPSFDREGVTRP